MPEKFKWNYTETLPTPLMDRLTAGYTSPFYLPNLVESRKPPKTSDERGYKDKNPYYEYLTDKQKEEWRLGLNRRKNFDTYYNKYLGSDPLYRSNELKWLAEYLAFIESRWNPLALNEKTNAKGLFLIMPLYWGSRNSKNIQDQFLRYKEMMDANNQGIIRLMKSGKVLKSSIAMSRLRNGYDANAMRAIAWLSGLGGLEGFLLKGQNRSDGGTTQALYAAAIVQRNLNNPKNKLEQQQYAYAPNEENTELEDLSQYEDLEPAYYYDDEDDYYTPQQEEYSPPEDFDFNNYLSDTELIGNEELPYNPLLDVQMPEPEEPSSLFLSLNNYIGGEDDYDYDNPKDFQSYLKQKQALEEQEQAMRIEELNAPTALNQYVEQLLEEPNKQFTKPVVLPLLAAMGGHLFGNGGDGRTTLPHVGDSWRNTETGESGTVVGYAPDVPYMGDDGKLYPTTSPVVKYDSGETLFGVLPQYYLPEVEVSKDFKSLLDWSPESWFGLRVPKPDGTLFNKEEAERLASHVPEYLNIEKKAKANNTWLKMPDGSMWEGDPRSWVMMQSEAFKKNYDSQPWYTGQAEWPTKFDYPDDEKETVRTNKMIRAPYYDDQMWFSNDKSYGDAFAHFYDSNAFENRRYKYWESDVRGKNFLSAIPKDTYRDLDSPLDGTADSWSSMPYKLEGDNIVRLPKDSIETHNKPGYGSINTRIDDVKVITDSVANWSKELGDKGILLHNVEDGPGVIIPSMEEFRKNGKYIQTRPILEEFISLPGFTKKVKFIEGNTGDFDIKNPYKYAYNNIVSENNYTAYGGPIVQQANMFGDGGTLYHSWDDITLSPEGNVMIDGIPYTIRALSKDLYPEGLIVTSHKKSPAETWMYHGAPINREGTLLLDIGYRLMTSKLKEDRGILDIAKETFNSLRGVPYHPLYTGNIYWNGETSYPNLNRNLHHLSMYGNNGQFEPDTIKYGFDYSDYLNKTYPGLQVPTFKGSIYNTGDNFDLVSPTDYKDLVEYLAETNKGTYTHPEAGEDIPLFENYENREFGIDDTGSNRVGLFYDPEARQYKVRASDIIDYGGAGKTGYSGRWGTLAGIQGNLLSKHLTYPALILNLEIPIKFSNDEADYKEGNSLEPVLEQIVADHNILRKSNLPYADYEYPFLYGNLQVTPQGSSFDMTRRTDVPLWNRHILLQAMYLDYSNNPYSKKFNTGFSIR